MFDVHSYPHTPTHLLAPPVFADDQAGRLRIPRASSFALAALVATADRGARGYDELLKPGLFVASCASRWILVASGASRWILVASGASR